MSLPIQNQTDQEIPIHIISTVDAQTALIEEKLARKKRSTTKKRSTRASGSKYLDVGLTVNNHKSKIAVSSRTTRSTDELANEQDQTEETEESLTHHKPVLSTAATAAQVQNDQDYDKENVDVSGRSIFTFQQTIKKSSNTMMKKALIVEKEEEEEEEEEEGEEEEEEQKRASKRVKKNNSKKQQQSKKKVDYAKRRRMERQLELLKDNSEEEEVEVEDVSEEEEEEEEMRGQQQQEEEEAEGYERYFQDLHTSMKTSNNTLSKLQVLEPQEFHQILEEIAPKKHLKEIEFLQDMHKQHFPQWYFELQSGFNLIFYGYGSKRNLLNQFAESTLLKNDDGPLIVVNGFFPSITIKDILIKITIGLERKTTGGGQQLNDYVKYICDYFSNEDRDYSCLYLLVHNLDGQNLRNEKTQTILSILASSPNIHLIASVDHINAGLLWDNVKSSKFNWIWHDTTTFDNYLVETSFENSLLIRTSELGGARGAKYVLDSLTSNARGVFKLLAEHQLTEMDILNMENQKGNESVGLSYSQYYQKCRENFFVSSDLALRTELTEFKDHKLISTKKTLDGTEIFYIPLDKSTLLSIIEQLD